MLYEVGGRPGGGWDAAGGFPWDDQPPSAGKVTPVAGANVQLGRTLETSTVRRHREAEHH